MMEKTQPWRKGLAKCSDHEVALAIALVEQHGLSSRVVAEKFEVASSTVRMWVLGSRRGRTQ